MGLYDFTFFQDMLDANRDKLPTVRHRFGMNRDGAWPALDTVKADADFSPILGNILDVPGRDLSSLRAVTGLDTPDTIERYQERTGGTFYAMYGQTETSCIATYGPYNDRPGAAGRPIALKESRPFAYWRRGNPSPPRN